MSMPDDFDFIETVLKAADERLANGTVTKLTPEEKVASDIWAATGTIGNGSFQYFFECELDAEISAQAYDVIGLPEGARLFRLALSLFPNNSPHEDVVERLAYIEQHEEAFDSLGMELVRLDRQMEALLAAYLRRAGYQIHARV